MAKKTQKTVSKKEITNLKKEIKELKKKLAKKTTAKTTVYDEKLKESMDNLSMSMGKLVELFTTAKDIVDEPYEKKEQQQFPNLEPLVKQNKVIAKGILAITEMLREYLPKLSSNSGIDRKYKILRVNKKTSNTPLPIERKTTQEPTINKMQDSGLPSVPESDEDFEFPENNKEQFNQ
jgi:regulator of replication initiation timing